MFSSRKIGSIARLFLLGNLICGPAVSLNTSAHYEHTDNKLGQKRPRLSDISSETYNNCNTKEVNKIYNFKKSNDFDGGGGGEIDDYSLQSFEYIQHKEPISLTIEGKDSLRKVFDEDYGNYHVKMNDNGNNREHVHKEWNSTKIWEIINTLLLECRQALAVAKWNYVTDINVHTAETLFNESLHYINVTQTIMRDMIPKTKTDTYYQERMKFIFFATFGYGGLDVKMIKKIAEYQTKFSAMGHVVRECFEDMKYIPQKLICNERPYQYPDTGNLFELRTIYQGWQFGTNHREPSLIFKPYLKDIKLCSRQINNTHPLDMFLKMYEKENVLEYVMNLMTNYLHFLYTELFCFVRRKLRYTYSMETIPYESAIPAYLIDTPFTDSWVHLMPILSRKKSSKGINFTDELTKRGITIEKIARLADQTFQSIGFEKMSNAFWSESLFTLPRDKNSSCTPQIWDMYNGSYRMKLCGELVKEDFINVHRLIIGIHYIQQYKHLSTLFRGPPCPGFIEGVETFIELGVSTSSYLERTLNGAPSDYSNAGLLEMALRKLPFMFHAITVDKWHYDVLEKDIWAEYYNKHWWNLRTKFEGIKLEDKISSLHLDAAMKYRDVIIDPYLPCIFGTILGFQLFREICIQLDEYNPAKEHSQPLHKCNIFKSRKTGDILKRAMAFGASRPWHFVLENMTQQLDLNVTGILDYFKPLTTWLMKTNCKHKEFHGWKNSLSIKSAPEVKSLMQREEMHIFPMVAKKGRNFRQ